MFLVPDEVGASEPFMANLTDMLARSGNEVVVFAVKGFRRAYPQIAQNAEVVEAGWSRGNQAMRILAENSWLLGQAKTKRLDLLHHGGGTAPFFGNVKSAVTIYDIQYVHFPGNFSNAKRRWLNFNIPKAVRSCDLIMVNTGWVRDDISNTFNVDPARFVVVPFGSEGLFSPDAPSAKEMRDAYDLPQPYFYFPSRTYPHKNHIGFLNTFEKISDRAALVFTGSTWHRDSEVVEAISRAGLAERVRHLGQVPRSHLKGIYENAVALVYPSLFEGFGGPVLEAMTLGCPVIASNATSIPEVAGDAAILLSPDDVRGWVGAMTKVLEDDHLRTDLITKGRQRAREFSWETSTSRLIEAYERVLS